MKRFLSLTMVIVLLFCGCTERNEIGISDEPNDSKKIQIGMSFDSFVIERWERDRDIFVSRAKELDAVVNVQNASGDIEEQISQIEYFIRKKMDAIVIIAIDSEKLNKVVEKAKDAGIKVIAYDRLLKSSNVDLYVSFDNEMVGSKMASGIADQPLTNQKVLMINGPESDNNVSLIEKGFREVMEQESIEILDSAYCENWRPELAGEYINKNSQLLQQVDAVMCGNDGLAGQVIHSLTEQRFAGKILVVGQDADLEACQRIVEGTQLMTVYKPVDQLARVAAENTVKLVKGESVGAFGTISDGEYEVPYIALNVVSVDKSNMVDVIVNSGFHLKEDVYLNVPDLMPASK